MMPFMDHLLADDDGSIRTATVGTAPNRQFIVEWRDVHAWDEPDTRLSFEIVMSESGGFDFRYADIDPNNEREQGDDAIIGVENEAGTSAVLFGNQQNVVSSGLKVSWTANPAYMPGGMLTSSTARNGAVTVNNYNAAGDLVTTTDPVGLVTANTYDNIGRVAATTTSATVAGTPVSYGTTSFTYNGLSEPVTVASPAVHNPISNVWHTPVATIGYDNSGRRTSLAVADTTGGDPTRTTTWTYDPNGRLISTTTPDTAVTAQTWNKAGDIATTTQPGGLVLTYAYDDARRPTSTTATGAGVDPTTPSATSMPIEARSYDPGGRLATVVDAMSRVTHLTYYGDNLLNSTTRDRAGGNLVVETRAYDPAGHPTTVTKAGGVVTGFTYDPAGNVVTQALDPAGLNRVTTSSYNPDSTIHHTTATGANFTAQERLDYTYDPAGRMLTSTVDNTGSTPASLTTTLVRDPRGLVTRETDPSGIATDHTYDLLGRPLTTTGAARTIWVGGIQTTGVSPVTTVGRNTFGDATHNRDPNANTTVTTYDTMSRPTATTLPTYTPAGGSPITATSSTTYNDQGLPATTTDALGNVTTYTYDKYGRILVKTDPDPDAGGPKTAPAWTYAYTKGGESRQVTDPTGAETRSTYDELGRQETSSVSDLVAGTPVYFTTHLGHDDAGNLTTTTDPLSHTTTTTYNTAGEPTITTDPTNRFTQTSYDQAGRVVSTVSGQNTLNAVYASPRTNTTYDLAGRPISVSECAFNFNGPCLSGVHTRTSVFDNAGRVTQTTSAAGRPTFYGYDTAGQLTSVTQRVDQTLASTAITVGLGYDRNGAKTRMVDGNGNATTYTYTPWGLPESTIEPSTTAHPNATDRTWTTVYNAGALAVEERLPGSVTRVRTYDKLGRLTAETGTGATTTARSLDYDPVGRITSATSPAGNHTYTYNQRGMLASASGYGGTATYSYNEAGQLTARTDGAGTAAFTYDDAGRLLTVNDPLTATTATNTYNTAGRLSSVSHGSGKPTRTYTYDGFGRIDTDTTTRPNGTVSASVDYGYDNDNLLTSKTTTGVGGAGANTYTYDGMGRVTSWLSPGGTTTTYGYDAASNRTTVATTAGTRTSTFDQRNRITATTGMSLPADAYLWNPRGQLTSATVNSQTTTYTYDAFERLTQAQKTPGYTVTFGYDSLDRPAQRSGANFGYDDLTNNPVLSPTALGETKLLRDPLGAALATKTGTSAAAQLLDDALHEDINATTDPTTGDLIASTSYDPWGTPTGTTGPALPLGFQGGYTDPDTTLVNAHARWYNPTTSTFTGRDTLTLPPDPIAQNNRYLYANDTPLTGRDPTGHIVACDDDRGNVKACKLNEAPRARYIPPKPKWGGQQRKARYPCGKNDYACQDAPTMTVTVPPPVRQLKVQFHNTTTPTFLDNLIAFKEGVDAGHKDWAPDAFEGLKKAFNDPLGAFDQMSEQAAEWNQKLGLGDDPKDNHGAGWVCVFMAVCDLVEDLANGDYYGAGYNAGKMDYDATAAAAGAAAGEVAAATLGGSRVAGGLARGAEAACSFTGSTLILLADGTTKPIDKIKPGDKVTATDPSTATTTPGQITALHINEDTDLTDLTIQTGSGQSATLHTTQNHPFWDATIQEWMPAGELEPGHRLTTTDGTHATVIQVSNTVGHQTMYNLTVADTHTYYVVAGNTPVLVHNDPGGDTVTVGRWMSKAEYEAMMRTGMVQRGGGGLTYVVYPPSPGAYTSARPGSVYVEFDVPRSSLIPGGRAGDYKISDSDTIFSRLSVSKGGAPLQLPEAKNVKLGGGGGAC
jgi:RHS repeat-associated protein